MTANSGYFNHMQTSSPKFKFYSKWLSLTWNKSTTVPGSAASRAFRILAAAAGTGTWAGHLHQCPVGAPPKGRTA